MHIFLALYVFSKSIDNGDLYASFGFSSRPTLMGLFLFFQAIWSPIDKVGEEFGPVNERKLGRGGSIHAFCFGCNVYLSDCSVSGPERTG